MPEIVNLNKKRKELARTQERTQAAHNAAHFGQSKAERQLQKARREKEARHLDAHECEKKPK